MSQESQFERVKPDVKRRGNAITRPWVILLSDWSPLDAPRLVEEIESVFDKAEQHEPLVFVVDDSASCDADHQRLLTKLTEAGAAVLEPEAEENVEAVRKDPVSFAARQLMQKVSHPVPATTAPTPLPGPSDADGYKEFAKAFTHLSHEDLEDIIKRSDS